MTDSRDRRIELLSQAESAPLIALADQILASGEPVELVDGPQIGMVMMQVREPVCEERFYLGEVLVTRAEVLLRGVRGWSMRLGEDTLATVAAAVLDAEVDGGGMYVDDVLELCRRTNDVLDAARQLACAALAPTEVHFDGID
jgi:alpha-D-ribose 1-methylphosphonate 5-triphosphate synthase subunit PhnG